MRRYFLVIIGLLFGLGLGVTNLINVQADVVPVAGVSAAAAKVTTVTAQSEVTYDWSVAKTTAVKAGDTATVTLPRGQKAVATTATVTNQDHVVVGTFKIAQAATEGRLTFNRQLATPTVNRMGTLKIWTQASAVGTADAAQTTAIKLSVGQSADQNSVATSMQVIPKRALSTMDRLPQTSESSSPLLPLLGIVLATGALVGLACRRLF